jgi:hypothetical protein
MAKSINNSLVGTTLLCHYGEMKNILPVGGMVHTSETLTAATILHCRHLVNFRIDEQNDRLYIAKVVDGFMDHEPVKTSILITDVLCGKLKWRSRHHTPALDVAVTDNINGVVVSLEQLQGPIPLLDPPIY